MRLDKYLKVSRLIKRRSVANEACDAGRVLINDKPAKASAQVKAGDGDLIRHEICPGRGTECAGDRQEGRSTGTVPVFINQE